MSLKPVGLTDALIDANIDIAKATSISSNITALIKKLQTSSTEDISENVSVSIKDIKETYVELDKYINDPINAKDVEIPQQSDILDTTEAIRTNIITPLLVASKSLPALYQQLFNISTALNNIDTSVYGIPKRNTETETETVINSMSLQNLKAYASFLGVAQNSSTEKGENKSAAVNPSNVLKEWLNEYIAEQTEIINEANNGI